MKINLAIKEWATAWKEENLSPRVRALISDALSDLYTGDGGSSEHWHGFSNACAAIKSALDAAPRQLWVDTDSGEIFENEPDCQEYVYHIARRDIIEAIVGKELAEYVD